VPPHAGCAPERGRVPLPQGLCPRSAQIAHGCIVEGGDRDRGEGPGAPEPGPWPRVTPGGGDQVARLWGHRGGGDAPADSALVQQGARAPGAAGARGVDEAEWLPLRLQLPSQLLNSALPGAERPQGEDLRAMGWGDLGERARLVVDIASDIKRARLCHGCPPSLWHACG
jgi:hypothetical protein